MEKEGHDARALFVFVHLFDQSDRGNEENIYNVNELIPRDFYILSAVYN